MILNINMRNNLYVLRFYGYSVLPIFMVLSFFKFRQAIVVISILLYMFVSLPVLYLHIVYYLENRGQKIIIDNNELVIKARGMLARIKKDDLDKVIYFLHGNMDKWGVPVTPMEYYNYIKIITKSGKQIFITCLMYKNLYEVLNELSGIPATRKYNPFFILRKNMPSPIDELR